MKNILTLLLSIVCAFAQAQISNYQHPCTIMGQDKIQIDINTSFKPTLDKLIIHDVDDSQIFPFKLKILKGDNYKISKGTITPKKDFNGILKVNIQINDGTFDSNVFAMQIQVGTPKILDNNAIFVAPSGNDNNIGDISSPIKTLQRAKELVKERSIKYVYFREGEYFMDKTVVFTLEDSGTETHPINYLAYNGEKVRFTGSKQLPYNKFERATPLQTSRIKDTSIKSLIKVINLRAEGIDDYGKLEHLGYGVKGNPLPTARLFINGAAMNLARYPNVGNFDDISKPEGLNIFKSTSGVVLDWEQTGDIWVDGSLSKPWEWQKNRISSISADSLVKMTWNHHSNIAEAPVVMFYYNIFEELDYPEEFFIDRDQGLLYVYFPESVNEKSDIRISQSHEPFIQLAGVNNLNFRGITFEGTRNSAIQTTAISSYNTFENCTITSCGKDGIELRGYGNRISKSTICHVGAAGVKLSGGDYATLKPTGNIVEDCKIHDFSQEHRAYNAGLQIFGVGQIARHIELFNGPHMAARISGVNHIIEYCDFHDAPREYSDMLAIYLCTGGNFFDRGTIIRRNKFHDVSGTWKQSAGVYLDNETNGVVVEENYFYDNIAQKSGWSVMIHGGADNLVRRNVFVDCSYPFAISTRLNGYAYDWTEKILRNWDKQVKKSWNTIWERAYPELLDYLKDGDKKTNILGYNIKLNKDSLVANYWNVRSPSSNVFKDNLVYNIDTSIFSMEATNLKGNVYNRGFYTVSNFRRINGVLQECLIHSNNHNVRENPGFINYLQHDLNIKTNAAILEKLPHLRNNYYHKIGIRN